MDIQRVQVSSLVFDDKLVEIRPINTVFVSRYRQAMRQEAKFPRPIVEKKTLIIASGNHRVTAYLEEYGPDHLIDVEIRAYTSQRERLRDAAEENAKCGNPLDGISQRRFANELLKMGDTAEEISKLFDVSVKRIEEWCGHTVIVTGGGKKNEVMPIKRGPKIEGEKVTRVQYEEHIEHDRGMPCSPLANQLSRWLDNGWIKAGDERSVEALRELNDKIVTFLAGIKQGVTA
jgi:hypothetical protein